MAVEGRAQRQQQQRGEAAHGAGDTAAEAPGDAEADDADDRAEQASRLEQLKRDDLANDKAPVSVKPDPYIFNRRSAYSA
jgi:hypothetical protein